MNFMGLMWIFFLQQICLKWYMMKGCGSLIDCFVFNLRSLCGVIDYFYHIYWIFIRLWYWFKRIPIGACVCQLENWPMLVWIGIYLCIIYLFFNCNMTWNRNLVTLSTFQLCYKTIMDLFIMSFKILIWIFAQVTI